MMHPSKLNDIWLAVGAIVLGLGLYELIRFHNIGSLLSIVIGGLVVYTSVYNMGGWRVLLRRFGIK